MSIFTAAQAEQARCLAALAHCNPFGPARIELERALLGERSVEVSKVWSRRLDTPHENPNVLALGELAEELAATTAAALAKGRRPANAAELAAYDDTVGYLLYHRYRERFLELILAPPPAGERRPQPAPFYADFLADVQALLGQFGLDTETVRRPAHLFAVCFQIRRAFHQIYNCIIGGSLPTATVRGRTWESIFTHDLRRYRRSLYDRLGDHPTLITGPTGTGKELVAQAVARSRYIPFDPATQTFAAHFATCFRGLNLAALSPNLIESELFGHRRGAYTGALDDRAGWLEATGPHDTVFLDEIGDLDPAIQVKLLRLLQTRVFHRLGETVERRFAGKIIAATNRDLVAAIDGGTFRTDLYYRLCADRIETVGLADQLRDSPAELVHLVGYLAQRTVGDAEAPALTAQVVAWIGAHLGPDYAWPGNVRELEQCVRNIMIHNDYQPARTAVAGAGRLQAALAEGALTADRLLTWYCTQVYRRTGSYQETGRRLGLDRRTVKAKQDDTLADEYPLSAG